MKILAKNTALVMLSGLIGLTSCTADFEDVNTNKLLPTDKQAALDGLSSGGLFPELIKNVIPTGVGNDPANTYQRLQNMAMDNWMGYFSPGRNHWDKNLNTTSFYLPDFHNNSIFSIFFTGIMNPYFKIKSELHTVQVSNGKLVFIEKDEVSKTQYAIAQIIKVLGMHRATDTYGPIPYTDMEPGKQNAKYDSQETVYRTFLKELDEAVNQLNLYGLKKEILKEYDPLYQGNTEKWAKLANSLMLRLAMRVSYADVELAKTYIQKATANPGGLIEKLEDVAKLTTNGKYTLDNSIVVLDGYGEVKMGSDIYSFLMGYDDPRTEKYFNRGTSDDNENLTDNFYAVRSGLHPSIGAAVYKNFSRPNIVLATPTYLLKASEVYFLLSEAALKGYITTDTAKNYYMKGIETSFAENGVITTAAAYLNNTAKSTPANFVDKARKTEYNKNAVSQIKKQWDDAASEEENLERIITQKYIAIYPNGFEAWSEWRRTGYPRIMGPHINMSNIRAKDINTLGSDNGIRRLPLPQSELTNNNANTTEARSLIGGADDASTNVWWDKKSKN